MKRKEKKVLKLKHYRSILTFFTFLADSSAILVSCLIADYLWSIIGPLMAIEMYEKLHILRYSLLFGVTFITILIGFEVNGLYQSQRSILNVKEFQLILRTWIMALGVTMVILYMADELYFSRGIFLLTWVITLVLLTIERYGFFKFNAFLNSIGVGETVVLIYGTGLLAKRLVTKFNQSPKLGYQIAGFIDDEPGESEVSGIPVLGNYSDLKNIIKQVQAERLFVAKSTMAYEKVMEILDVCRQTGCRFQAVPNIYDTVYERVRISDLEGIPLFGIQEHQPSSFTVITKRLFDISLGLILLIFFFPVALGLAAFLKIILRRPIIIKQTYKGRYGKTFQLIQFSYHPEKSKIKRGKLFRLFKMYWYPQLINILKGEMSFVGPRPDKFDSREKSSEIKKQKLILWPGLTGLWDVATNKGTDVDEDKDLDIYYIQNQSIIMDFIILLKKMIILLKG